ncbi:hypothetical protein WJX81_003639 [Elliptochloris bilobata]|uniref:DNA polymerase eta n=1 Tax=Elliptochloris bilobata TaxID=381761 RepID=A0AAW1R3G8_9CHLO
MEAPFNIREFVALVTIPPEQEVLLEAIPEWKVPVYRRPAEPQFRPLVPEAAQLPLDFGAGEAPRAPDADGTASVPRLAPELLQTQAFDAEAPAGGLPVALSATASSAGRAAPGAGYGAVQSQATPAAGRAPGLGASGAAEGEPGAGAATQAHYAVLLEGGSVLASRDASNNGAAGGGASGSRPRRLFPMLMTPLSGLRALFGGPSSSPAPAPPAAPVLQSAVAVCATTLQRSRRQLPAMQRGASGEARCILHLDLDCYYCQVEQKRCNIPADTPCAVQQWEGLIAVNYAARAAGITRHMRVWEAKKHCPELQLVHVEVIGKEDGPQGGNKHGEGGTGAAGVRDRQSQKACLERYRSASREIIALLHKTAPQERHPRHQLMCSLPGAVLEKASIDEVYMDVTALVDKELQERADADDSAPGACGTGDAFGWGSIVLGGPLDPGCEWERRLAVGAQVACRLRGAVRQQLGFTCSAGIACNKLLAKVASAMNKPNQQTVVPPRAVADLMAELPLKKLRNFGGKLGAELAELGCSTAGQVLALPTGALEKRFGPQRAACITAAMHGCSDEPVMVRELPKTMLAAKSFEKTTSSAAIARWLRILAEELAERLAADGAENARRPRSLSVTYRGSTNGVYNPTDRSKSGSMPRAGKNGVYSAEVLAEAAAALLRRADDAVPCYRLAVTVGDFTPAALSCEQGSIARFFAPAAACGSDSGAAGDQGASPVAPAPQRHPQPPDDTAVHRVGLTLAAAYRRRASGRLGSAAAIQTPEC